MHVVGPNVIERAMYIDGSDVKQSGGLHLSVLLTSMGPCGHATLSSLDAALVI